MKRFAIRTIKNGSVVINGVTFKPREDFMKYDGRLNGMRYAFGLYQNYSSTDRKRFVSLWGTADYYYGKTDEWTGPECIDGAFPWEWWDEVK